MLKAEIRRPDSDEAPESENQDPKGIEEQHRFRWDLEFLLNDPEPTMGKLVEKDNGITHEKQRVDVLDANCAPQISTHSRFRSILTSNGNVLICVAIPTRRR